MQKSILQFKLQYGAYPGDMRNAQTFWNNAINGDGNGRIDHYSTSNNNKRENLQAWKQLKFSGLLPSSYEISDTDQSDWYGEIGNEIPASHYDNKAELWIEHSMERRHHPTGLHPLPTVY